MASVEWKLGGTWLVAPVIGTTWLVVLNELVLCLRGLICMLGLDWRALRPEVEFIWELERKFLQLTVHAAHYVTTLRCANQRHDVCNERHPSWEATR